jgi:hypothetical protein
LPKTETNHVPHAELATGRYQEISGGHQGKISQKQKRERQKPTLKITHSNTKKHNPN